MRLKSLEITNFKCIGEKQKIDFKPITLLFGRNNSGKSTILHALHYLREVLTRENLNPSFTKVGGNLDLGGFESLVHKHQLGETITIKITVETTVEICNKYLPLSQGDYFNKFEFTNLCVKYLTSNSEKYPDSAPISSVGIELNVSWDELRACPQISVFTTEINEIPIANLTANGNGGLNNITNINFLHPHLETEVIELSAHGIGIGHSLESKMQDYHKGEIENIKSSEDLSIQLETNTEIPPIDEGLKFSSEFHVEQQELSDKIGLEKLFSEMMLGPIKIVKQYLEEALYIGPLREIPPRNFKPKGVVDESHWFNGLAAWEVLCSDQSDLIDVVNEWFLSEDRFDTHLQIKRIQYKEVEQESEIDNFIKQSNFDDSSKNVRANYIKLPNSSELYLEDVQKNVIVKPSDVGVGISQLLPIVVATLNKQWNLLSIEQPELHIHPALQVELGDLFIHGSTGKSSDKTDSRILIIETHSEHLLFRLTRRIRETFDKELPPKSIGLTNDLLTVIYADDSDSELFYRELRINEQGKFIDPWPHGFFEELAEELY